MDAIKKKKVLIGLQLPPIANQLLSEAGFEVTNWTDEFPMTREELIKASKSHDALLSTSIYKIDEEFLETCSHLDIISQFAVGYDNINVAKAKELNITLANTPGTMTDATADIAFALMLGVARNLTYLQNSIVEGKWKYFNAVKNLGIELKGKTLGVFGMGRIGAEMAMRCKAAYHMPILYHNRKRNLELESKVGAQYVGFETLLKESDVISAHCNLTTETKHTFDKAAFQKMKKTAIFINTARGKVHHESDLIKALKDGEIWGAGLDVTDPEPMAADNPLLSMKNVVVLPHVGSGTIEARTAMATLAAKNIINYYSSGKPVHEII